jgi:hypothetical protein
LLRIAREFDGDDFKCYYDGQLKFNTKDSTFKDAGKVGLWTKADSVIYFDDLTVIATWGPRCHRRDLNYSPAPIILFSRALTPSAARACRTLTSALHEV